MFEGVLKKYFSDMGVSLSKSFIKYTKGIISSCSFSTNEIARHVSKKTGHDFNTSVKGLNSGHLHEISIDTYLNFI